MLTYLFYPLSKPVSPGIKGYKNTNFKPFNPNCRILFWAWGREQGAESREHGALL